jgi:hypothetical protein
VCSSDLYPHLLRAKCAPLVDTQEFKEILDQDSGAEDGSTLRDLLSTYQQNIDINNQIVAQAEADVGKSGYDTEHLYVLPMRTAEALDVGDTSNTEVDASSENMAIDASLILNSPKENYYVGYLTGDGIPPNGAPYGFGITFPSSPVEGQFYLRSDYMPNRLFRYDGRHWVKFEDNVRMTINQSGATQTNNPSKVRKTQKASFINNTNTATIAGEVVVEKQALSKALRPRADN